MKGKLSPQDEGKCTTSPLKYTFVVLTNDNCICNNNNNNFLFFSSKMWKCLVYIAVLVDLTIRGMFYLSVSIYPIMIFMSEL